MVTITGLLFGFFTKFMLAKDYIPFLNKNLRVLNLF